ncbi:uncharacterized protein VP01_339g12 [Puccinia sorghi]|uniref:Uncharacterized protein n=1 Tax=Puccinia sorghi TaxID=27349 RepID=A0A0L6UYK0_9BASI|nr:uncharacterized protein VP01_339g12 [Puccinia sorghi]
MAYLLANETPLWIKVVRQSSQSDPTVLLSEQDCDIPEEEWVEALHFSEVTANGCWSWGNSSHSLHDYPTRHQATPVNKHPLGPYQKAPDPYPQQQVVYPTIRAMFSHPNHKSIPHAAITISPTTNTSPTHRFLPSNHE